MENVKVGIIGYGYWGPNLTRNFYEIPESDMVAVADVKEEQLERARSKYPDATYTTDYHDLFDMGLDAVVISTPPDSHYPIAKECLENGLSVLVEKPLTLDSEAGELLVDLAATQNKTLMVGHTFEYNSAVLQLRDYIVEGELGDIYYIDAARLNLGLFQKKSHVLWDLAPHDISILLYLLQDQPVSVSAHGMPCVFDGLYDVVYLNLIFKNNVSAYVHVSWLDPCKVRRVTVVGSEKMAVFNDVDEYKIKIYDKGVDKPPYTNTFDEFQCNYRYGNITIPNIRYLEPLKQECLHFIDCVSTGKKPVSDGISGLRVVKIIEAAEKSIKNNSTHEVIKW